VTLPNFLVVGAGRSGTTSLHRYLHRHPDVFVPDLKAPSYFYALGGRAPTTLERQVIDRDQFVHDPCAYEALFDAWSGQTAIGEVSPAYLCAPAVPERIAAALPGARIVALLRNPVDRLHARFVARRRDGLEREADLAQVVRAERRGPLDLDDTAGTYVASGFVSHVLRAYLDRFPTEQVCIRLYDDLHRDPVGSMREVFTFLGVDRDVPVGAEEVHNRSGGTIANPLVRAAWTRSATARLRLRRHLPAGLRDRTFAFATRRLVATPLDEGLRRQLTDLYRDEIRDLGGLIDRDLSPWLDGELVHQRTGGRP
jgi:hypothetical protein